MPPPKSSTGNCGAIGATNCLPKKNARPLPKMIIAIPAATSLTRGSSVMPACSNPSRPLTAAAASAPNHGEPERSETQNALIAPISKMPSIPRLMRPLFSVRHSPKLTNMYGMLPRTAPPASAIATPQAPMESGFGMRGVPRQNGHGKLAAVESLTRQNRQEDDSLKNRDRRIRKVVVALQNAAAGHNGPKHQGDDHDAERRMP